MAIRSLSNQGAQALTITHSQFRQLKELWYAIDALTLLLEDAGNNPEADSAHALYLLKPINEQLSALMSALADGQRRQEVANV